MELKKEQYEQIKECFPKQRKPAKISSLDVLNAVLYVVGNGYKRRSLPKEYGDFHVIYVRVNRWAKKAFFKRRFCAYSYTPIKAADNITLSIDNLVVDLYIYQHHQQGTSLWFCWTSCPSAMP